MKVYIHLAIHFVIAILVVSAIHSLIDGELHWAEGEHIYAVFLLSTVMDIYQRLHKVKLL